MSVARQVVFRPEAEDEVLDAARAHIDPRKLYGYLLSPTHRGSPRSVKPLTETTCKHGNEQEETDDMGGCEA